MVQRQTKTLHVEQLAARRMLTDFGFVVHSPLDTPQAQTMADIDGDGDNDLISGQGVLSWHSSNGDGTFADPITIGPHSSEQPGLTGGFEGRDFDGDGDVDLIRTTRKSISWFENRNGQGRFGPEIVIMTDLTALRKVDFGNINDDDWLDIIFTRDTAKPNRWLESDGKGGFVEHNLDSGLQQLQLLDFDLDGDDDLLAIQGGAVVQFENQSGNFGSSHPILEFDDDLLMPTTGLIASYADLDQDGDTDAVIDTGFRLVALYQIRTDMIRSETLLDFHLGPTYNMRLVDFDSDGDLDIYRLNIGDDYHFATISVNDSDSTFATVASSGWRELPHFFFADANNDGVEDLVDQHHWYQIDPNTLQATPELIVRESVFNPGFRQFADLSGDGEKELLYALTCPPTGACDAGVFFRSIAELIPKEERHPILPETFAASWFEAADVDGDGDNDVVGVNARRTERYAEGSLVWVENIDGQGLFSKPHPITDHLNNHILSRSFYVADTNQDGVDEFFVLRSGIVTQHWWNGNEFEFEELSVESGLAAVATSVLEFGDLNDDGLLDVIVAGEQKFGRSGAVWAFENSEGGLAKEAVLIGQVSGDVTRLKVADFNGDNLDDIIASTAESGRLKGVHWLANAGNGSFDEAAPSEAARNRTPQSFTDINQDGLPDITFNDNWLETMLDDGTFETQRITGLPAVADQQVDMDSDGDLDVVHGLTWYERRSIGDANGDGRFDSSDLVRVFQTGTYDDDVTRNSDFETGDWNGDGEFDSSDLVAAFKTGTYRRE